MKTFKFLYILFLALTSFAASAQTGGVDSRINKLPTLHFSTKADILPPSVLTGGEALILPPKTGLFPAEKKYKEFEWFACIADYHTCSYVAFVNTQLWSSNMRFVVNNCVGCSQVMPDETGSTTFSQKRKSRNSISKGFVTSALDTPWAWCNIDKDYVLAITNEGSVVTTDPVDVKTKKNSSRNVVEAEITEMRGLWLVNPRTGKRQVVRDDVIKESSGPDPRVLLSADSKTLFVKTCRSDKSKNEGSFTDLATGKKAIVQWSNNFIPAQMGKTLMLATEGKDKAIVFRFSDGSKLLEYTSKDTIPESFFLTENDELYLYKPVSGEVAVFKENGNELKLNRKVSLQQEGLKSSDMAYHFMAMKDFLALVPKGAPRGLSRWDDGYEAQWGATPSYAYPVFFDLKTGKPAVAVLPFLTMRPTAAELKAKRDNRCKEMKQQMQWKEGSLLCRKKTATSGSASIYTGVDCDKTAYKLAYLDGNIHFEYALYDYELCAEPGKFTVCTKCKGTPHTITEATVSDDRWEQVNFNIYVRDLNKTKTEYREFHCDLCKGKGYLLK